MFGRIFIYVFFLLIAADIYIFFVFIKRLTKSLLLRSLWFLPTFMLLAGLYYFYLSDWGGGFRGFFTIAFIALSLPKILFTIISLFDIPFRIFFRWKIFPFTIVALAVSVGVEFIVLYGGLVGQSRLTVKEVTFSSPNIPDSFDGYRIAQLSDLHLGNWKNTKTISRMVSLTNKQNADVIMITGDLVHYLAAELDGYEDILSGLSASDGVYSIMGNHDYGTYHQWKNKNAELENLRNLQQRQLNMGWKLLNNEHVFLAKGNDSITLIGVENDGEPPFTGNGDLSKAMKGAGHSGFKLLLSHNPSHWRREVLDTDIDLMLSGHTHGAQLVLGGFSPSSYIYPEWGGMYREGNQGLYVNVGIGGVIPFRFGAWPEITIITLKQLKIES